MKVTLLGDSIRLGVDDNVHGYGIATANLLKPDFEVFQPEENCRFAKNTLRGLFDWAESMRGSRVVHWNNGHWDVCRLFGDGTFSSDCEYVECMLRIATVLKSRYDAVIFATTTPVKDEHPYNRNSDIVRFNSLLVPELEKMGVVINDLHSLVKQDVDRYIGPDMIHLTDDGVDVCAHAVADKIRAVAKTLG